MDILRQITISSGTHQQHVPSIMQINLTGEPLHPELNSASGEYVLQDEKINELPFWRHTKFAYVIWYNIDANRWMISHSKDIGTSKCIFAGPVDNQKWPNEISFKGKSVKMLWAGIVKLDSS